MPKAADIQLIKTFDPGCTLGYEVRSKEKGDRCLSSEFWSELEHISSFAFYGASGNFTARKEVKQRGGTYWVAYRKVDQKLYKKYIGKTSELATEKLESVAATLGN